MSATASFVQVQRFLAHQPLGEFVERLQADEEAPRPNALITLKSTATVKDALQALSAARILSAPVLDAQTGEYVGMFDVADALRGLMLRAHPELLDPSFVGSHPSLSASELQTVGSDFVMQSIDELLHGGDLWYRGDRETDLMALAREGFRVTLPHAVHAPQHHLRVHHRIALFDIQPGDQTPDGPLPEWRVIAVVSQSDLLHLLVKHLGELDAQLFQTSIERLGMVSGQVSTAPAELPAMAAFAQMHRRRLSALGVVGGDGALLGNVSASDLRGLAPERFAALALPVAEFIALQAGAGGSWEDVLFGRHAPGVEERDWRRVLAAVPLVNCGPRDSLADVVRGMAAARVHRTYVVGEGGQPLGVITVTDVLRRMLV